MQREYVRDCVREFAASKRVRKAVAEGTADDYLMRDWTIFVCKDRTLTYGPRGEPPFNGVAIPVFSVDTEEDADRLIVVTGQLQYTEHTQMPGQQWRKISIEFLQLLEISDLPRVTAKLRAYHQAISGEQ